MLTLLSVVVGVAFVYLLLALICTTVNEWIAGAAGLRGKTLEAGVGRLLGPLAADLFSHPLVASLSQPGKRPSCIPPHIFSSAVVDLLDRRGDAPDAAHLKKGIAALKPKHATATPHSAIEDWFNASMDRVSGWYKRRVQLITIGIAVFVTVMVNADTLQIVSTLWKSPASALSGFGAAGAGGVIAASYPDVNAPVSAPTTETSAEDQAAAPNAASILGASSMVGWSPDFRALNQGVCSGLQDERDRQCADAAGAAGCRAVLRRIAAEDRCTSDAADIIATDASPGSAFVSSAMFPVARNHALGWLLTIIAISLGAGFWFDLLSRFVNIRGTGPKA